jgi:transcriptional regulator GlxA family with amidase domain
MGICAPPLRVALLAPPPATASTLYGMYDLLASTGRDWSWLKSGQAGAPLVDPVIVSADGARFRTANGAWIQPDARLDDVADAAVICVPDLMVAPEEHLGGRFDAEIAYLRTCHARGAILASACSGALLLAEAGLLDGYEATTHWAYCDSLAKRYPKIRVRHGRSLVVSGTDQRLMLAGGGTSWYDLALYLVARLFGTEEAMRLARLYLVEWHDVGQQPYAMLACARNTDDAVIAHMLQWLGEHFATAAPVAALLAMAADMEVSERSFQRRFAKATGMSPLQFVHMLRLEEAKQLLEATARPVEGIANDVGYEDASFFSRLFRRKVGITPAQYRRRFGALRRTLGDGRLGGARDTVNTSGECDRMYRR